MTGKRNKQRCVSGVGQLSLVEHALCPLDFRRSLVENVVFAASYAYSDQANVRQTASARVFCPLGLSAADELYLWGLLSLTLGQPERSSEVFATPHWFLRRLGLIDPGSRRGGRQYQQFSEALRRLSTVTYMCDAFYDPVRAEHRRVSFRFFSYSLPVDPNSNRAWRIVWDPIFFEMVAAPAGHLRFDLATYRSLDVASRRMFLFLCKVFSRRQLIRSVELRDVAINLLGFSPTLAPRDMKAKVTRCLSKLQELGIIARAEFTKRSPGQYQLRIERGRYFATMDRQRLSHPLQDSPLAESLVSIGFEEAAAMRLVRRFPQRILAEWIDITQAAMERYGPKFFRKSPMAYLVDSVTQAAKGNRTAPDWWQDLRRAEERKRSESRENREVIARLRREVFGDEAESKETQQGKSPHSSKVQTTGDILSGK